MASATLAPPPDRGLAVSFLVALLIHLAALGAFWAWRVPSTRPPGSNEITVDLAPAMQALEALAPAALSEPAPEIAPAEVTAPSELRPVETPPETRAEPLAETRPDELPPVAEALPAETAEPPSPPVASALVLPPDETVIDTPAPLAEALPPPVPVPSQAPPTPEPLKPPVRPAERKPVKPVERPRVVERPKPAPRRVVKEAAKPAPRPAASRSAPSAPSARARAAAASRENTGGSAAAAADPNALARYAAQLAAAIRGRLRYPDAARAQGVTGTAAVRILLNRSGRVLSVSLLRSAGHPILDAAALATVPAGASLPAAPDGLTQQQFSVPVPLQFTLR